jgi:MFS family permease
VQEQTKRHLRDQEWPFIALASAGHALCHVAELVYSGVLAAVCVEFGLRPDRATALALPGLVLFGLGAIPAGLSADRWGSVRVLSAYFLALAAACLSAAVSQSPLSLAAALTAIGAIISIYHPAGLAMLAGHCRRRGRAMGIHGVAGSIGLAIGPALGLFMAERGFWRGAYLVVAAVSLACGAGLLAIRARFGRAGGVPAAGTLPAADGLVEAAVVQRASGSAVPEPSADRGGAVSWRVLSLLFAAMVIGGFNYRCLTTALPIYFAERSGSSSVASSVDRPADRVARSGGRAGPTAADQDEGADVAGVASVSAARAAEQRLSGPRGGTSSPNDGAGLLFLILALGAVGQLAGGHVADRVRPSVLYVVLIGVTIPAALAMAWLPAAWSLLPAGLLALFMFAQQPVENTIVAHATGPHNRSTAYAIKFVLTFGLGALGIQAVGELWHRFGSVLPVFLLFALCATAMAAVAAAFSLHLGRRSSA